MKKLAFFVLTGTLLTSCQAKLDHLQLESRLKTRLGDNWSGVEVEAPRPPVTTFIYKAKNSGYQFSVSDESPEKLHVAQDGYGLFWAKLGSDGTFRVTSKEHERSYDQAFLFERARELIGAFRDAKQTK